MFSETRKQPTAFVKPLFEHTDQTSASAETVEALEKRVSEVILNWNTAAAGSLQKCNLVIEPFNWRRGKIFSPANNRMRKKSIVSRMLHRRFRYNDVHLAKTQEASLPNDGPFVIEMTFESRHLRR